MWKVYARTIQQHVGDKLDDKAARARLACSDGSFPASDVLFTGLLDLP